MKTLRKIPPAQLALMLLLLLGLTVTLKFVARAQDASSPWHDGDIGGKPQPGSMQTDGSGTYILSSAGRDIWSTVDSFNYLSQPLTGDGQIVARVLGMQGTNQSAKAGVMLRESLAANSRNAMMEVTLGHGTFFQWRQGSGGHTERTPDNTNAAAPYWVKLVRHGDWVGGYSSADGIRWQLADWQIMSGLPSQFRVGLAVANHSGPGVTSVAFDQVTIAPVNASDVLTPFVGAGDGLAESCFNNRHLYGMPITNRVDRQVDLGFLHLAEGSVSNATEFAELCQKFLGISKKDQFGVRWTGEVQAQFSEPYTIYAEADDGVRVWLDEQLIMDKWDSHQARDVAATVNLVAGQRYLLRVEYYQNHGDVQMKLRWSSPSTPKRMIAQSQLYSQPLDVDGNGLPDIWEKHYFGQTGVDPNADPDNDGLSNLQEWRRHSDPTSPLNWGVPNEWTHGDIEDGYDPSNRGRAAYDGSMFTVSSAGEDIWGSGDHFHYVYQAIGTNGEIVARVLGMQGMNQDAKAGLMLRETLDSSARNAMQLLTHSNRMAFQWRSEFWDRTVTERSRTNPGTPYWMKLARNNDWVGGYVSADGTNWGLFEWETMKGLAPNVFVGLAVAANNPGGSNRVSNITTAQFDQVKAGPATEAEVMSPVVGDGDGLLAGFRNDSLQYLPGLTNVVESQVDRIWIHYLPPGMVNPDSFGVCWSGEVDAQFTEPYTFILECMPADWVRVWVNDQLIVNGWHKWHRNQKPKGTVNLVAGERYLIRVEMFNNHDHGMARLIWGSPSTPQRLVPQSQLYSQPLDSDGNGLPDTWEVLYFGHIGVDPNADPDNDGLSNLQEYRYHTNPLKADTDNDGMPDAWEVAHGLDPQFNDAALDYDNSGWSNLQKYLYGLDPFNADVNGDGLPDSFEVGYLGVDVNTSHAGLTSVAASASGSQAVNLLGNWQVDGNEIYALDRRGGLDFILSVGTADKYILNLTGTQNQYNPFEIKFKLLLGIDGETLGHYTLNAGYGTNGLVELVLPYLTAGSHTVHVFWDGVASYSSLRIKQVNLLSVSGTATNQTGLKDWVNTMVRSESGLDATNATIGSYISSICLEGRDPYPTLMQITNNMTNALSPVATSDKRWYVNAPLQANTQTVFQASYQNGAVTETRSLQWLPVNLLTTTNRLNIRRGDSLLFTALPAGGANGNLQVSYSTNTYSGKTAKGIAGKFAVPGVFTVTGTYIPATGSPQSGSVTVNVVQQSLPNGEPAAWTWLPRYLLLPGLAPEAVLQADSRLACTLAGTNTNGVVRLNLEVDVNEPCSLLARLGTNGPVLDSTRVSGFDEWSGGQTYTKVLQVYEDGSQLVEMMLISSPVEPDVTFVLEPIASGVIFEDGTMVKTLDATSFDALGQCRVRFVRPASLKTSVCHSIKAYQGNYQVGYRH